MVEHVAIFRSILHKKTGPVGEERDVVSDNCFGRAVQCDPTDVRAPDGGVLDAELPGVAGGRGAGGQVALEAVGEAG